MLDYKESITAKICAFARAQHSNFNKDKLFDDFLAFDLLGNDEYEYLRELIIQRLSSETGNQNEVPKWDTFFSEILAPIPLSRIAYTESKLLEFAKQNGSCQYVICGAGLDSFAFRNSNPNIEIFELDHPLTQERKIQRIRQLKWIIPDNVHFVSINFENQRMEETLLKAGFHPEKRTFFSILGVSYYLTLDTLNNTFSSISKISSPGSALVFDYPDDISWKIESTPLRVKKIRNLTAELGEKMTNGFRYDELEDGLNKNGFNIVDYQSPMQIQDKYFKNRTDNLSAYENVHFMEAEFGKG